MHLSPSQYVAKIFIEAAGGVRPAAKMLGIEASTICKWASMRERSGLIPAKLQRGIYEKAQELNLNLTIVDLLFGKEFPDEETNEKS